MINEKITPCLVIFVIIESVLLTVLIVGRERVIVRNNVSSDVSPIIANPLYGALEYESPDAKFESFIKENPGWMMFIPPGASNSILATAAELGRTNYVRILIANGADSKKAVAEAKVMQSEKAVYLIQKVQSELTR